MRFELSYQEIQQFIKEHLHRDVDLQCVEPNVLKMTLHLTIKKIVTFHLDASADLTLSVYDKDLYVDYKALPIKGDKLNKLFLPAFMDFAAPNIVNVILDYYYNKYPQYKHVIEQVPNACRLRIHLDAIPQLEKVLKLVKIETFIPREDYLQIIGQLR